MTLFFFLLRSFLIALLIVASACYVFFCPPVLTTIIPGLILLPRAPGVEYQFTKLDGIEREEVRFKTSSGEMLNGWYFRSKDPSAKVLLFNHGSGGNIGECLLSVKRFLDHGLSVFVYDYRAFGKSQGQKSVAGTLDDSEAAYNYLVEELKVDPNKLIIYGMSYGGATACHLAEKKAASALILESSFASLLSAARKRMPYFQAYPEFLAANPPLDNSLALKHKTMPLLIIHGANDPVIPVSEAEENFKAASNPKRILVLKHSGHFVSDLDMTSYQSELASFFRRL
ncbi:MAG: alpha/beta fold hydrolase [Candidatus Obscuribacterales bacterium]|nr:alpha/beta fold hydrolase [Candidatus Obscuribacterales bacterium]